MQYNYENYLERMQGIILEHNYDHSYHSTCTDYNLKILVNHPFNAEISISMNTDAWNKYINYSLERNWKRVLDSHPDKCNSMNFYFNHQKGKFYIGLTTDDEDYPVWQETTLTKIVHISRLAWIFSRHIHIDYNRFHTGQTCDFFAYAKDKNDRLHRPSTIDKDFSKYNWIYNPLTFKAYEITSESIEHLIAKTPPPKHVADKLILENIQEYQHSKTNGLNIDALVAETPPSKSATLEILQKYKFERKQSQKKARQQLRLKVKTTFFKLWKRFTKQKNLTKILIVTNIISILILIWWRYYRKS